MINMDENEPCSVSFILISPLIQSSFMPDINRGVIISRLKMKEYGWNWVNKG